MKRWVLLIFLLMLVGNAGNVLATENQQALSEKVWSIHLNSEVLNTVENLSQIHVIDVDSEEKVDIQVKLNDSDPKIVEVFPKGIYEFKKYKLVIPTGFQSKAMIPLKSTVIKEFTVNGKFEMEDILGKWETTYSTTNNSYAIKVEYKQDKTVNLVMRPTTGDLLLGEGNFVLQGNSIGMSIIGLEGSLAEKLKGNLYYYNQDKFVITRETGSKMIFVRTSN